MPLRTPARRTLLPFLIAVAMAAGSSIATSALGPGPTRPALSAAAPASAVLAVVWSSAAPPRGPRSAPVPTPADFLGISGNFVARGISVSQVVGGDAGCADPGLAKTAISFRAAGLDQTAPVPIHLYIFGSRDSYQKLRASVDACAGSYITNPNEFVSIDAPPFVVVSQGPWGPRFTAAIRQALTEAAGSGS